MLEKTKNRNIILKYLDNRQTFEAGKKFPVLYICFIFDTNMMMYFTNYNIKFHASRRQSYKLKYRRKERKDRNENKSK